MSIYTGTRNIIKCLRQTYKRSKVASKNLFSLVYGPKITSALFNYPYCPLESTTGSGSGILFFWWLVAKWKWDFFCMNVLTSQKTNWCNRCAIWRIPVVVNWRIYWLNTIGIISSVFVAGKMLISRVNYSTAVYQWFLPENHKHFHL